MTPASREGAPGNKPVTLHPLLVTRVAALLTVGFFSGLLLYGFVEASVGGIIGSAEPPLRLLMTVPALLLFAVPLYLMWRAWRHGVRLTVSSVIVQGLLYDRTIPIRSVTDVSAGFIWWDDAKGRVRSSIVIAFAEVGPLLGFISTHNERSLEHIRRHACDPIERFNDQQPVPTSKVVESRAYDRPELRRPRRSDSGKRAGARNRMSDAWPSLVLLAALTLASVLGLCLTVGPALWLYELAPTPGPIRLAYSNDPYNLEKNWDLVALVGPLTIILAGSTARLAYLMFRPTQRN